MAAGPCRAVLLAALLLLCAAAPLAADDGAHISRPGVVLVDPAARRAVLDDFAPGLADRLCRGNLFNPRARIPLLHDPGYLPGGGVDSRLLPLTAHVMEGTARAWARDDAAALDAACLDTQGSHLFFELSALECLFHGEQQVVSVERLADEIERARLHSIYG